jgi:hypothetical protein
MKELKADNPAVVKGTTIFLRQVKPPQDVKRLLQPASVNAKLGAGKNLVAKGKWRGMPLFQLTLEERKTCPTTCQQWRNCYGNNMPFANRIDASSSNFLKMLKSEVQALCGKHTEGIVIRLHVLGDFYSVQYVEFWRDLLKAHPNLHLFGYTHTLRSSAIGKAIAKLNKFDRSWIRWSDAGDVPMAANVGGVGITCPQQTGKTASCLTCGLCWATTKPINFLRH